MNIIIAGRHNNNIFMIQNKQQADALIDDLAMKIVSGVDSTPFVMWRTGNVTFSFFDTGGQ